MPSWDDRVDDPRFTRGVCYGLLLAVPFWVGVVWAAVKVLGA